MATWPALKDMMVRRCRDRYPQAITYTPQGSAAVSLIAVFDEAHEVVEVQDGVPVSATRPVLDIRPADLSPTLAILPRHGDIVTIGARQFVVSEVRPAGGDSRQCYLNEVGP